MKQRSTGRRPRVSLTIRVVAAFVLLFVATLSGVAYLTDWVVGLQLTRQARRHIRNVAASLATEKVPLSRTRKHLESVCKSLLNEPIPLKTVLPRLSRTIGYDLIVFSLEDAPISTAAPIATTEAMRRWRGIRGLVRRDKAIVFDMMAESTEYRVAVARRGKLWLMVLAAAEPFPLDQARLTQLSRSVGYELITTRRSQLDAHTLPTGSANEVIGQFRPLSTKTEALEFFFDVTAGGKQYWVVAHRIPGVSAADRWVLVAASVEQIATARGEVLHTVVYVALTGMGLVIIVAYLIAVSIANRARALAKTVAAAFADPTDEQQVVSGDEISIIEQSFEDLLARLADYQQRLVVNERLAVMGKLSASVVHEIRNPLTAMKLTAQMLEMQLPETDDRREGVSVILGEINRLQSLCEELLVLSGRRRAHFESIDPAEIVRQTAALLAPQADEAGVRVEIDLPDEPLGMRADGNQLRQLLLNLLLNAVEASESGGRIALKLEAEDDIIRLWIDDWGSGIDPAIAQNAGEQLASTKQTGAGLGLAVCRRIVENHYGKLEMTNRGDGTRALIVLPATPEAESKDKASATA